MYELVNLEKEEYEKFVKNNKYKSHFLQSYAWGQFAKARLISILFRTKE